MTKVTLWLPLAATLVTGCGGAAMAAEVGPGGRLDVTISGFAAVQAHSGALDNQRQDPELGTGLDFSNDTEVHVILRGLDDRTGLGYGGTVEFSADTNDTENTEKSWLFVRGGFGELRLGDEEGPVEESVVGGLTVAAGTGGIDGEVVDELAVGAAQPTVSDTATKVRYYTPEFAGFQFGVSYTPNADDFGDSLALRNVEIGDWVEGALVYEGELADSDVEAALIGSWGDVKDRDSLAGKSELWAYHAGAAGTVFDLDVGAGFGDESIGGQKKRYLNAGVGREFGEVTTSITYGRVLHTQGYDGVGEPWNVVLSADVGLLPGLVLQGDLAYFDNDLDRDAERVTGGDDGLVWVTRVELAF